MNTHNEYQQEVRLFIAIDMPPEIINHVIAIQKELACMQLFDGTYTKPEQVHITLKFIGNIALDQLSALDTTLKSINFAKQKAHLGPLDVFTRGPFIKIILLTIVCPHLVMLAREVDQKLIPWCKPEDRDFVNHVTIARVKHTHNREQLLGFIRNYSVKPIEFIIDAFVLKKSELFPEGPVHTEVHRYELM